MTKISFESFEYDHPEPDGIPKLFLSHPELNASAVARRLGISQCLMAQYISGNKTPSPEREGLIVNEIRNIGKELSSVGITYPVQSDLSTFSRKAQHVYPVIGTSESEQ